MRSLTLCSLLLVVATTTLPALAQEQESPASSRYSVRSGQVQWETRAFLFDSVVMKSTLYFTDFGAKQRVETKVEGSVMGETINDTDIVIVRDGYAFIYTPGNREGEKRKDADISIGFPHTEEATIKFRVTPKIQWSAEDPEGNPTDIDNIPDSLLQESGITRRQETIMGKSCNVYSFSDEQKNVISGALWSGVPLYFQVVNAEGEEIMTVRAVSIDKEADPAAELFEVPRNVLFFQE